MRTLKIDVEIVAPLVDLRHEPATMVIVDLKGLCTRCARTVLPASHNIPIRNREAVVHDFGERWLKNGVRRRLALMGGVRAARQHERVAIRRFPVGAKAHTERLPTIVALCAVIHVESVDPEVASVDPEEALVAKGATVRHTGIHR
jgi:hypothetical protein